MASTGDNLNQLQKLYKIVTPSDLIGRYKLEKLGGKSDANTIGEILNVFVNTADNSGNSGLLRYDEINEKLLALKNKANEPELLDKHVVLYDSKTPTTTVLGPVANQNSATKLYVMAVKSPMLGVSLRDVNKVGMFLNAIPSVELTRCLPRLEVQFDTAFTNPSNRSAAELSAQAPTLLKYLNGNAKSYGSADKMMADASTRGSTEQVARVVSGMELFTTPQTMSPDSTLTPRNTPVLDRFASLMTIESLEITAVPAGGVFANKTARLNLILHDRSRLHEVASLIKPDAYSQTTVALTYGWSHPDTSGENPIADLINQMVVHGEKYNIYNSSFSFGQGGGVRITLQLSMKGTNELRVIRIADSDKFFNLNVQLDNLSRAIRDAREKFSGLTKPEHIQQDVRVYQLIDSAANNAELLENYSIKDLDDFRKLIKKLQDSPANKGNTADLEKLKNLSDSMVSFVSTAKERNALFDKEAAKTNKTPRADDVLGKRFSAMIGHQTDGKFAAAEDPYLVPDAPYWKDGFGVKERAEIEANMSGKSKEPRKFVSLAKLMLYYVGVPLQSVGTIDEVQFVYYPLNSEAGYAAGTPLSSFPVEVGYFRDVMADYAKRKRNANITAAEFVQLLNTTVLSDVRHPAYGMREVYQSRDPKKPTEPPALIGNAEDVGNRLANKFGGVFRKPVVEMQIETRGGRPLRQGEVLGDKEGLRIMRIHVYDKLSTAYEPTLKVLEAQQRLEQLRTEKNVAVYEQLTQVANQIGLNLKDRRFSSYEDLKSFISQVTPVLNYGSNASGIIAATVQSMQNSDLATVNMQRAMGQPYNSEPNSSSTSALPLRVQPSQLDLTLLGCPLLNLAQQFFVDFSTGTTIDDLYVLTHLSHVIAAGKFESTAKFTPMNAYGAYENVASKVQKLKETLDELIKQTKK